LRNRKSRALFWTSLITFKPATPHVKSRTKEVREAAECKTDYHDCYRKVYRLIRDHDKRIATAFDNPSRSNAFLLLANIISEGVLTAEELKQFSQETQTRIKMINELRGA
jgi:hypothetical protein